MFGINKMCRLVCMIIKNNDPYPYLEKFFLQSIEKKNTPGIIDGMDADYHQDGLGFANFVENQWHVHRSVIMNYDFCFHPGFASSSFIIGHLRNKGNCEGEPSIENTHPFQYASYVFCHNGFVRNFLQQKPRLFSHIHSEYIPFIKGQTDSEILFFLLLSLGNPSEPNFLLLHQLLNNLQIQYVGNFILAICDKIYVTRLSNTGSYCSLYINSEKTILSSEPLTRKFELIPENSIWMLENNQFICQKKL